jgi:hypothetical protein
LAGAQQNQKQLQQRQQKTKPKSKGPHARLGSADLEKKLAAAQARIAGIDQQMLDPAVFTDGAKIRSLQIDRAHAERELQEFEEEWLLRAETEAG